MRYFSTEFPQVKLNNKSEFIAQVISWVRGMKHSIILNHNVQADLDGVAPVLKSDSGEELRFRSFGEDEKWAVGFRHDIPDNDGRLWRTEGVCGNITSPDGQHLIRLRTQCIAIIAGARLDIPRKPYLIKSILADGLGGRDGLPAVSDQVKFISDDDSGLLLGREVARGTASKYLPIVYFSASTRTGWAFSNDNIKRFAYELGGIAHVIVEPSRRFSMQMQETIDMHNLHSGAVGVILPGQGIIQHYFVNARMTKQGDAVASLRKFLFILRSQMPAEGWDWTELQEQALRQQRERERNQLTHKDIEDLYEEEIKNFKDQVAELKAQISQNIVINNQITTEGIIPDSIISTVGMEIYSGELLDRIRAAAKIALSRSEQEGLDNRSVAIFQRLSEIPLSEGLDELLNDIKRATKNSSRMSSELSDILCRHGYEKKAQSKHLVLEPRPEFSGLDHVTISTTPSDTRGLRNAGKQVERALGLTKIK